MKVLSITSREWQAGRKRPKAAPAVPPRRTRQSLEEEISMWRALWCDQPEDRLYHAKDQTWWRRNPATIPQYMPWSPVGAPPPPEIMVMVRILRRLPRRQYRGLSKLLELYEHFE